jgi:hypothetical protein
MSPLSHSSSSGLTAPDPLPISGTRSIRSANLSQQQQPPVSTNSSSTCVSMEHDQLLVQRPGHLPDNYVALVLFLAKSVGPLKQQKCLSVTSSERFSFFCSFNKTRTSK